MGLPENAERVVDLTDTVGSEPYRRVVVFRDKSGDPCDFMRVYCIKAVLQALGLVPTGYRTWFPSVFRFRDYECRSWCMSHRRTSELVHMVLVLSFLGVYRQWGHPTVDG